jgi:hypothetical protein
MLGVRRASVTAVALELAKAGLVATRRGHVGIIDQPCYCRLDSHAVIETATDAVRIKTPPWRETQRDGSTSE